MQLTLRPLGATDLLVSPIGLGTVKFGRNTAVKYPQSFTIPSDQQVIELLSLAKELNINLLDTAPAYGNAEERLGKLLLGQRHDWILMSKAGEEFVNNESSYNFSEQHITASVERSLQRLKTDYIDILLIHSNGDDLKIINEFEVFNTLKKLQTRGLIRYTGMSTKTVSGGILTLEHCDVAMITFNPIEKDQLPVLEYAKVNNKAVVIKKALASGHVEKIPGDNPIETAYKFILQHPAVASIIAGTINPKHLQENAAIVSHCT